VKARIWKHRTWNVWFASVPDESGFGNLIRGVPTWEEALSVVLAELDAQRAARP
jgi:hypothetical protein